jgi:hypothetical protein
VVTNQQELAKSKFKSYIEAGTSAEKATGIEDKIMTTFKGKPPSITP